MGEIFPGVIVLGKLFKGNCQEQKCQEAITSGRFYESNFLGGSVLGIIQV